jgi:hypothetical protein
VSTATPTAARPDWDRLQRGALIVGAVALLVCGVTGLFQPTQFFRAYLIAFNYVLGIVLGCLVILMLQYLTGGAWGVLLRRLLETVAGTLPLLALFFVPLAFGMSYLYVWARPGAEADPELARKAVYLNVPFFLVRTGVYFVIWAGLGLLLPRMARPLDRTDDPAVEHRLRLVSAPGLVLYGLAITFASIDWAMSLEPHWYSTIYPVMFALGQVLSGMTFAVAAVVLLATAGPLAGVVRPAHLRDLGNLTLAFVMIWAYLAFSQFLLIWAGNLPEETPWYLRRLHGGLEWVGLLLIGLHFALPFLLLLSKNVKTDGRRLAVVAGLVLVMRFVDLFWLITPGVEDAPPWPWVWLDVAAVVGLGGVWLAALLWQLRRTQLVPPYAVPILEGNHHHA